jgi:hypothetical protein
LANFTFEVYTDRMIEIFDDVIAGAASPNARLRSG